MKHVKATILAIIIFSNVALLGVFYLLLNYSLPKHFEKEAHEAINYEADYFNSLSTSGDSEDIYYEENYISDNIQYLYPEVSDEEETDFNSSQYSQVMRKGDREIREFYEENELDSDTNYVFKTSNGYYILRVLKIDLLDVDDIGPMIVYVNILPFLSFLSTMNGILLAFVLAETVIMCIIGWKQGKRIEDGQKAQRTFFQNTSHELKTPLMSIQGYAEGICSGIGQPIASAEIILHESDRMTRLIEELLFISKVDAGQLTLQKTKIDARELLYDAMIDLQALADMMGITLEPRFSQDEIILDCDEKQMEKAFRNILSNALRHGKKQVLITCEPMDRMVKIRICDDGEGIAQKDLPHLFQRFYAGEGGSTGIGLSLAYEIIRMHRGKIRAYNENGAVFEILLPQS